MIQNVKCKEHRLVSLYWHFSVSLLVQSKHVNKPPLKAMSLGATNFCFQYNRHNFERSDDITAGTGYIGEGEFLFKVPIRNTNL